ncbi:MAG: hypothetical protein ACP59X_22015 [Solidesulfovibrio sp. DCME]|uniref:hypothetical protein n=1 Tax=Solidesulfovibrio sp. DCME TaxID=3447380 RepID=UPI003D14CA3F
MLKNLDVLTLAFCFGICCCSQFLVFYLHYRTNASVRGPGWWTASSLSLVCGFLVNFFRDIALVKQVVVVLYGMSFVLSFSFIYMGIARFKERDVHRFGVLTINVGTLVVLLYTVVFNDSIPVRRTTISIACSGHVRQRGVNSGVLEVALGQAALGGIWAGCASFGWVLSSAMASTCM